MLSYQYAFMVAIRLCCGEELKEVVFVVGGMTGQRSTSFLWKPLFLTQGRLSNHLMNVYNILMRIVLLIHENSRGERIIEIESMIDKHK